MTSEQAIIDHVQDDQDRRISEVIGREETSPEERERFRKGVESRCAPPAPGPEART